MEDESPEIRIKFAEVEEQSSSFEDIFDIIGHFGKYQILLYILIVYTVIPSGANVGLSIFVEAELPHKCITISNHTSNLLPIQSHNTRCNTTSVDHCHVFDPAKGERVICENGHEFETNTIFSTISSDFGLICDEKDKVLLIKMIFFLGFSIGPLVAGYLSDNYGRRYCILVSGMANFLIGILTAFSQNWWMYMFLRFLLGITSFVPYSAVFVFIMEITGSKVRTTSTIMVMFLWEVGFTVITIGAFNIRTWWTLQIFSAAIWLIAVMCMLGVDESPRFLICQDKVQQAENVMQKIGERNGNGDRIGKLGSQLITKDIVAEIRSEIEEADKNESTVMDLFKHGRLMTMTVVTCVLCMLVISLVYYSLLLNPAALPFDVYTNNVINSVSGLPGYIISCYMASSDIFGRRWTVAILCTLSGALCIAQGVMIDYTYCEKSNPDRFSNPYVVAGFICSVAGRATIAGCLATWQLFIAELFPTEVRATALGMLLGIESIMALFTPALQRLAEISIWLPVGSLAVPNAVAGILGLFGGLLSLRLPETHNKPMLMSIEQAVHLYSKKDYDVNSQQVLLNRRSSRDL